MRVPSYSQQRSERRLDFMTSMIDIVFLLLIFFVCNAAGLIREWLIPDLPTSGAVAADAEPVVLEESWSVEVWLKLTRDTAARKTLIEMTARRSTTRTG